jgi:2-polyprenyl-3-methyl-5-hydroxy-6-metoxy-1,4-benzoquinol methylase
MKEIFDNYVETSFDGLEQAKFKFRQFEINYGSFFPKEKSSPVLDIGIGRGEMLTCMRDWGFNYQGVDISPSTVRFCQSLNLKCQVVEDTAAWLLQNKETFALITCLDVLEHVPRDHTIEFLKAIRASLRDGGQVIIQVPNLQSPFGYLHHFNDFTHVSGFVEHSLAQVLLAAGFVEFKFRGFEEIFNSGFKHSVRKSIRYIFRKMVRFMRRVNGNPNPEILDPVMYVVARK